MLKIQSGKFTLNCLASGAGQPLLVIGNSLYYSRVFDAGLRQHLQMVFADHRGFADTNEQITSADYSLDVVVDDIELVRTMLSLGEIVLVGHSGYGYFALAYAKKYTQSDARSDDLV